MAQWHLVGCAPLHLRATWLLHLATPPNLLSHLFMSIWLRLHEPDCSLVESSYLVDFSAACHPHYPSLPPTPATLVERPGKGTFLENLDAMDLDEVIPLLEAAISLSVVILMVAAVVTAVVVSEVIVVVHVDLSVKRAALTYYNVPQPRSPRQP